MDGSGRTEWLRVTKSRPCPICQKSDWCLFHSSGDAAICPRVFDGCKKDLGDAGYLHVLRESRDGIRAPRSLPKRSVAPKDPDIPPPNWVEVCMRFDAGLLLHPAVECAAKLGVSQASLMRLGIGNTGKGAWTFPMRNGRMEIIGIRVRGDDGRKWAIPGSRNGLFIPDDFSDLADLWICEGPTDTAALTDLGYPAIGRPNCSAAVDMVCEFAPGRHEAVIVADNDDAGWVGAVKLANALWPILHNVKIISPPKLKDVRAWKQHGANRALIDGAVRNSIGFHPKSTYWQERMAECGIK